MRARLYALFSTMVTDGGGNRNKPYLTDLQRQTLTSVIANNFFLLDRKELHIAGVAQPTGRAARYLHMFDFASEGPNVQGTDDFTLATDKLIAAIHDFEALELCVEWKIKNDKEQKSLETLAFKLYKVAFPHAYGEEWVEIEKEIQDRYLAIAKAAKELLGT